MARVCADDYRRNTTNVGSLGDELACGVCFSLGNRDELSQQPYAVGYRPSAVDTCRNNFPVAGAFLSMDRLFIAVLTSAVLLAPDLSLSCLMYRTGNPAGGSRGGGEGAQRRWA